MNTKFVPPKFRNLELTVAVDNMRQREKVMSQKVKDSFILYVLNFFKMRPTIY